MPDPSLSWCQSFLVISTPYNKKLMTIDIDTLIGSSRIPLKELREISKKVRILPLYWEMGGWYGLTVTGDIVSATWDHPENTRMEDDPRIRNLVLFQGARFFPELDSLVPIRESSDTICPYCNGSGTHPWADRVDILCFCGGLGWIPNETSEMR